MSFIIYINPFSSRMFWKAGHGHDLAGQNDDEASTCRNLHFPYMQSESRRSAQLGGIITEGSRGLGNAYRHMAKAHVFDMLQFLFHAAGSCCPTESLL